MADVGQVDTQAPALHFCPAAQTFPQAPQLVGLDCRSTQAPLHGVVPTAQDVSAPSPASMASSGAPQPRAVSPRAIPTARRRRQNVSAGDDDAGHERGVWLVMVASADLTSRGPIRRACR